MTPLNYDNITIARTSNTAGKTTGDPYRCRYDIFTETGEKYVAFNGKGATLLNLAPGTKLRIGWKFLDNRCGSPHKSILWFEIVSTPAVTSSSQSSNKFSMANINAEYAHILAMMAG
ncbi:MULTISPECIES: hypothetical protein [Synechocystis]|uniref:Uncharacterized protein n=1 Tax=Synechocystis salina LEGE 00031 TaxID=1828736 RepID=A0ABR9VVB5_9SYNC|nr:MULTISPECIES: hypothetical protein [Synechocystis]MBD2654781.1 hypothetical protein [Synechocystis sp. FACHB-383]MBE9194281.1 hypothetical protein [Synechocystis sp. LEGE 06083]MBE9242096.1 hypothetical protein [Synechocystis salina LEGE 00041]MBE9255286.1 hypothetical protein [Synechocystis salina LEGE 00031]